MSRGVRKSLKAQSSRSGRLMYVPLALVGIASTLVLLAMQAGMGVAITGVALVGLSSFVTTCLVKHYPEQPARPGTVTPAAPGWLKLINVGVEIWMDLTVQTKDTVQISDDPSLTASQRAIARLKAVPGITAADLCDFDKSRPFARLQDGAVLSLWTNLVGVEHVFLANYNNKVIYGGFVGWIHSQGLQQAIAQIKRELT